MNLLCVQIESLRLASLFYQTSKPAEFAVEVVETEYEFYLRTKGIDWVRAFYRPSQESEREDDREIPREFQFQSEPDQYPAEYPFQDFNYGP